VSRVSVVLKARAGALAAREWRFVGFDGYPHARARRPSTFFLLLPDSGSTDVRHEPPKPSKPPDPLSDGCCRREQRSTSGEHRGVLHADDGHFPYRERPVVRFRSEEPRRCAGATGEPGGVLRPCSPRPREPGKRVAPLKGEDTAGGKEGPRCDACRVGHQGACLDEQCSCCGGVPGWLRHWHRASSVME
jgi:hypothetical protein